MALDKVRQALETRLGTMSPAIETAWENRSFTPTVGTPYQQVFLLPGSPENPSIGSSHRREIGIFQVSLMYAQNAGPGAAQARALAVQAHFPRAGVYSAGGTNVLIIRTPTIHPARVDGDRFRIDIDIPYQAEVFG